MLSRFRKKAGIYDPATDTLEAFLGARPFETLASFYQVTGPEDGACVCNDWIGAVIVLHGTHADYPSLADAMADGVFHEGCRHGLHPFDPAAGVGKDIARAAFCTKLAIHSSQARRAAEDHDAAAAFARVYDWARNVERSGGAEVALALCEAAAAMLQCRDIFGDRQARVERTLKARIATIRDRLPEG